MTTPKDPLPMRAGEYVVNLFLRGLLGLVRLLPYRMRVPAMGWLTSRIVAPLAGYSRRVRENLAHACPDLPEAEIRRLTRDVPDNAGRNIAELYSPESFAQRARTSTVRGPGLPAIREARAEKRPVIFVTGHFGNFNAARIAMIEQGFDMGVFYRPMKNRYFNRHYIGAMAALSEPMFEQGKRGMVQMVKHVRGGGVLAILADLNAHDGYPLEFFGKPALTSLVTAELALKFNAPLVPVWGLRAENGIDFDIIVEEPIQHSDPKTMLQEFNSRLEAQVRDHMGQWLWIHRRWKDGTGPLADYRVGRSNARSNNGEDAQPPEKL